MNLIAVNGAKIVLKPSGSWEWSGWNGEINLSGKDRVLCSQSNSVAIAEDVELLASELIGKAYKAKGFADVPGMVTFAEIEVAQSTLSERLSLAGNPTVLKSTTGHFSVKCMPSLKAGAPPVPDPNPSKSGTWHIESAAQSLAHSV